MPLNAPAGSASNGVLLDTDAESEEILEIRKRLSKRIVGQRTAVEALVSAVEVAKSPLQRPGRPHGIFLFVGPTGCGKTRVVEAMSEILFGSANMMVKIDCAEFKHSHEIAKLIGSPPGYLGHRETVGRLHQTALAVHKTEKNPFNLVLFDEIEKASDALWDILLGVLDKGSIRCGDNTLSDLTQSIIVMTSNLGAREMADLAKPVSLGFTSKKDDITQDKLEKASKKATRRCFSPEFINRIDDTITFRSLTASDLAKILRIELARLQFQILSSVDVPGFVIQVTDEASTFLVDNGTDPKYGARPLRRVIDQHIAIPLRRLVATKQIAPGDTIIFDHKSGADTLVAVRGMRSLISIEDED